ncbi:hypothetical protein AMATHDRAFT_80541 [Amanita thiersii Skay4041]|uniref:Mitochondrial carrier n=1 Tax=Amanita thiersii Skay4041 TaxID=703135 RepID=A0A2A9NNQ7_9AGAR|nr:hypothetical protein AMATHDRAFT_80541 [Amanita thiersii Skay4041]
MDNALDNGNKGTSLDSSVGLDPTIDFIAGTLSGIAGLIVGYPFDTVKVRFQSPAIAGKYKSTLHALVTIIREERFVGLYKGITSPLATAALLNGVVFASYRFFMKLQLENGESVPTLTQIGLAGVGSGIVSTLVTTPTELIKIRQQDQLVRTSPRQVALQILRESGIRGLYRGVTATALRDTGYGAYFAAYEATCRYFSATPPSGQLPITSNIKNEMESLSWPALMVAGGVAGIVGWIATFPFDVVKTRMQGTVQAQPTTASYTPLPTTNVNPLTPLVNSHHSGRGSAPEQGHTNPYRTVYSTIINSYRTEGIGVFFRGLAPTLIRAIPVNMVTFVVFETVIHALS